MSYKKNFDFNKMDEYVESIVQIVNLNSRKKEVMVLGRAIVENFESRTEKERSLISSNLSSLYSKLTHARSIHIAFSELRFGRLYAQALVKFATHIPHSREKSPVFVYLMISDASNLMKKYHDEQIILAFCDCLLETLRFFLINWKGFWDTHN